MAEYIANRRFRIYLDAVSAGVQPGSISQAANAIYTLKRYGIDAGDHIPRDVREINLSRFDLIVSMDNDVAKKMRKLFPDLSSNRHVSWRIDDPYGDDLGQYDRCATVIQRELKKLVSKIERSRK